jgi:hypothetical protein
VVSRLLKEKEAVFAQKKAFASYKEKLEKFTDFTTFRVNKMFFHKF